MLKSALIYALSLVLATSVAQAIVFELAPADLGIAGSQEVHVFGDGSLNGYTQRDAGFTVLNGPGGNGNFGAFLGTSDLPNDGNDDIERGHNIGLSGNPVQPEVKGGTLTDDAQLSEFGFVSLPSFGLPSGAADIDGGLDAGSYLTVALDMNPINSAAQPHITYQSLQVWISPTALTTEYTGLTAPLAGEMGAAVKVWDMDAFADNSLTLNPSNKGSGTTDMLMYVSVLDILDADPNANADYYLYLWVELETYGETNGNQHGYVDGDPDAIYVTPGDDLSAVPEPSHSVFIAALSAIGFAFFRRRKRS